MLQLALFDQISDATSSQTSWLQHILRPLHVDQQPAWPDRFGSAIHAWFLNTGIQPIRTLSLFSGGGGLDIGFADAGFESIHMVEIERKYVRTLEANTGNYRNFLHAQPLCLDIRAYEPDADLGIDFIIGGPPCQSFSAAGRRAAGVMGTLDPRGVLFEEYARLLATLQPKGFLFENVYGVTGAQNGEAWQAIQKAFLQIGYSLHYRILDAADYGVPQHRERLFIVGLKNGTFDFPCPTHGPDSPGQEPYFTASGAVRGADISGVSQGLGGQYGHLLEAIPPGLNYSFYTEKMGHPHPVFGWRSKFSDFLYKADPATPVRTIKAQGGQYTGPFSWENRPLSLAEFKRLQTIPDTYEIVGNRQVCIEQIGNSVPPQLARMLALSILNQVFGVQLPFPMRYLSQHQTLGFRQRQRKMTEIYARKAEAAIAQISTCPVHVPEKSNSQEIRYLSPNFQWGSRKVPHATSHTVSSTVNDSEACIRIHATHAAPDACYEIIIQPNKGRNWGLPVNRMRLIAEDQSFSTFTALWKATEEQIGIMSRIADLVQLSGYYQYEPQVRLQFASQAPLADTIWPIIAKIMRGDLVAKQLQELDYADVFSIDVRDVLPMFGRLRRMGYEIRNHRTNPQITQGEYLIPYAFPTLTHRSIQLKKNLGEHHG